MISAELLEEIIYVSNRHQLLDKRLITKIALSIIDNLDDISKKRFGGIKFLGDRCVGETNFAQYNRDTGYILMNSDKIKLLKIDYDYLLCNLELVHTLTHEINHLREEYKKTKNDIESFLIVASDNFLAKNKIHENIQRCCKNEKQKQKLLDRLYTEVYFQLYEFMPSERIAEIESYEYLIKSLEKYEGFKEKYSSDLLVLKHELFKSYVEVYVRDIIPIVEYFKLVNQFDSLNSLTFYSAINREFMENSRKLFKVEDRFKYGLPTNQKDKVLLLSKMR